MVQDYLDYQNLQVAKSAVSAAWESLSWAKSATFASWVSVIVSITTLGVAFFAMNTWRVQEKVKAKREIKKAAGKLYVELGLMPEKYSRMNITNGQAVSKSPRYESLVKYQNEIDEWIMHDKLSELYLQLKYLGYAVGDDLTNIQKKALKDLDSDYQQYYTYASDKNNFEKSLGHFLKILEVYK